MASILNRRAAEGLVATTGDLRLYRMGPRREPVGNSFFVPPRPCAASRLCEDLAKQNVLLMNRLFSIHSDEVKNDRQRFVFRNHTLDELLVTLIRIIDV